MFWFLRSAMRTVRVCTRILEAASCMEVEDGRRKNVEYSSRKQSNYSKRAENNGVCAQLRISIISHSSPA